MRRLSNISRYTDWYDPYNGILLSVQAFLPTAKKYRDAWSQVTSTTTTSRETIVYEPYSEFSVFTSPWSKLKIVTIQWIKSRFWDTIDDWYMNNLAKNQVSAVFHPRIICRSVSPKFIELCMETPCLCSSEGHKYGGRKVTKTSVTEFCYWNEKLLL